MKTVKELSKLVIMLICGVILFIVAGMIAGCGTIGLPMEIKTSSFRTPSEEEILNTWLVCQKRYLIMLDEKDKRIEEQKTQIDWMEQQLYGRKNEQLVRDSQTLVDATIDNDLVQNNIITGRELHKQKLEDELAVISKEQEMIEKATEKAAKEALKKIKICEKQLKI